LVLLRDDRNLFTQDAIEEGGLTDIRPPQDGNKTRFKRSHSNKSQIPISKYRNTLAL
jgi:hypothetical protein